MHTVYERFATTAGQATDDDFLQIEAVTAAAYGIAPGRVSWREAGRRVRELRDAYAGAGWGHGHRVGLLLENRPDFLYHWFALNALGVSVVPINAEMRAAELEYLIGHSEIGLAVTLPGRERDLRAAAVAAGMRCRTLVPGGAVPAPQTPAPDASRAPSLASECALLYTSGTTGRPKGCRLSNDYFLRAGQWYAGLDGVCSVRPGRERVITPLPLNHVNAMAFSTMVVVTAGGCLIQLDRFHPRSW
ncbi:MAG: AMP-binding protein, partial [Burkholderiales bacterium]|nr:AMP-binding protein [Burkholderiales bacterium]